MNAGNRDQAVVDGFGDEWSRFDQSELSRDELEALFQTYFAILPWDKLPRDAVGFDLGSGSGRWAKCVAPRVGKLYCVDASLDALNVARRTLSGQGNCEFLHASVEAIPLADASMDFGYSLGVLHHVPDTEAGLRSCVSKLKRGAPFLLYLYYALDNRPAWYRGLWRATDWVRRGISRLPHPARYAASQAIAATVYYPLARGARMAELCGLPGVEKLPLSAYRERSFYTMRTDALDRFGTRLEQRFTREQIHGMMERSGLTQVRFSDSNPYWVAVGVRG